VTSSTVHLGTVAVLPGPSPTGKHRISRSQNSTCQLPAIKNWKAHRITPLAPGNQCRRSGTARRDAQPSAFARPQPPTVLVKSSLLSPRAHPSATRRILFDLDGRRHRWWEAPQGQLQQCPFRALGPSRIPLHHSQIGCRPLRRDLSARSDLWDGRNIGCPPDQPEQTSSTCFQSPGGKQRHFGVREVEALRQCGPGLLRIHTLGR
jgi:hypothetical protein